MTDSTTEQSLFDRQFGNDKQAMMMEHLVTLFLSVWVSFVLQLRNLPLCLVFLPVVMFYINTFATEEDARHAPRLYSVALLLEFCYSFSWTIAGAFFDEKPFFTFLGAHAVFLILGCFVLILAEPNTEDDESVGSLVTGSSAAAPGQEVTVATEPNTEDDESAISEAPSTHELETITLNSTIQVNTVTTTVTATPDQDNNNEPSNEDDNDDPQQDSTDSVSTEDDDNASLCSKLGFETIKNYFQNSVTV